LLMMTGKTQQIDVLGLQWWRAGPELALSGPTWLATAARDITSLGSALLGSLVSCAAAAILIALQVRRDAVVLLFTVVTGWIFNNILKAIIGRPRPDIVPHLTAETGLSFPSGHSFTAAAVYIAIALAFMSLSARPSMHRVMIGTAIVLSLIIALSRVILGVHYPSDITAGWFAGAAWALTIKAISLRSPKH